MAKGKDGLRAARAAVIIVLAAAVPVVFDPHSGDVFNLPEYTLTMIGALVLIGLWIVAGGARPGRAPVARNGLQWVVGAVVAWTAISAFAGVDVHVSLVGQRRLLRRPVDPVAAFGVIIDGGGGGLQCGRRPQSARDLCLRRRQHRGLFYGLIQLHDTEVHGTRWDFILWNLGSFSNDIFSTLGNPNHLGGYLAMILPVVVVLGFSTKRWWWRAAAGSPGGDGPGGAGPHLRPGCMGGGHRFVHRPGGHARPGY